LDNLAFAIVPQNDVSTDDNNIPENWYNGIADGNNFLTPSVNIK